MDCTTKQKISLYLFAVCFSFSTIGIITFHDVFGEQNGSRFSISKLVGEEGSGDGQFRVPHSIAFDSLKNVYVTDTNNHRVQKFTSDGQFVSKWGTEGTGDGEFSLPLGIDTDSLDNVYVADQGKSDIQKFTSDGQFVSKWGTEEFGNIKLKQIEDIEIDSYDNIYITDRGAHQILKITLK